MTDELDESETRCVGKIIKYLEEVDISLEAFLDCWVACRASTALDDDPHWIRASDLLFSQQPEEKMFLSQRVFALYSGFDALVMARRTSLQETKSEHYLTAAFCIGAATSFTQETQFIYKSQETLLRSSALTVAGAKGAKVKNQRHKALKTWALEKAKGMRDQDIDVARKLSGHIPEHLKNVSKNAERLIYDALRANRTTP